MSKNEFLTFCLANVVILIVLYTIFIIFFVSYIIKKVTQMKKLLDNYLTSTQNNYQEFLRESNIIDKQSWQIKKNQEKAIIDINYILSLLDKYKGEKFNTEINHQVSNEILSKINENLKNDIPICDTSSIVDNNLIDLYKSIKENTLSLEDEVNAKKYKDDFRSIDIIGKNRFSEIVDKTIDIGQNLGSSLAKKFKKDNKLFTYDENNFMKELKL